MKFISLFAGVGGFDLALERAGHECVYANDFDKYCKIIYDKNFCTNGKTNGGSQENTEGKHEAGEGLEPTEGQDINNSRGQYVKYSNSNTRQGTIALDNRSITDVPTTDIPDHDLLVGGFPCQSFSIAGKRRGFADTRGTLFFEIARILKDKKPSYFILENVKGLLSHDGGFTFKTIIATITELGYDCEWQVLNSKNYGVPQNRERVFIVGHLRGTRRPEVFPIGQDDAIYDGLYRKEQDILSNEAKGNGGGSEHIDSEIVEDEQVGQLHQINNPTHSNDRIYGADGISPTLNTMQGGRRQPKIYDDYNSNWRRDDITCTLIPNTGSQAGRNGQKVFDGIKIRRLTPIECERLQGFPEVEKSVIIELCLDQAKNSVNVGNKNHRLQKSVGNVEKTESAESVQYVVNNFNIKYPQTNSPVQTDVLISCGERTVEIHSQGKLLLSVNTAGNQNLSALPMPVESFVQMIAGITTMSEKITNNGKEELRVSEQNLMDQENGKSSVMTSGKETMQPAKDVKNDLIILKELLKSITSNPFAINPTDTNLKILFSYVLSAISGYIPSKILQKSSLIFQIDTKLGYTYGVSDTQRYKMMGNAVTVNVVYEIAKHL